ncbi:hypothetical protein ABT052_24995 [Streptomyces sp. NPDC002766]|uniref:hypothetical protein n=1 Tax=unclassified Streptomyces TaxID=2593676 RepID=UPI00332A322F
MRPTLSTRRHWLHFPSWPRHSELGPDGHPRDSRFPQPVDRVRPKRGRSGDL